MTEARAAAGPGGLSPVTVPVAVGLSVAALVLAMLLHPTFGLYVSDGAALVCALATAGLAVFAAGVARELPVRRLLQRLVVVLAITGSVAALLTIPFDVMAIADDGLRGLGNALARSAALHSGEYQSVLVKVAGFGLVAWAFHSRARRPSWLAVVGGLVIVGSFVLTGHARSGAPGAPTAAVVATLVVHVAAAAMWFGGLIGLGVALRRLPAENPVAHGRLLATFARTMTFVLALLVAAGAGLTILYLPSPDALVTTAYGQVLLMKLAVLVGVLVLSAANHARLVPEAVRGSVAAVRVLRANLAAEQIGLLAIIVITEVLMRQNPGG